MKRLVRTAVGISLAVALAPTIAAESSETSVRKISVDGFRLGMSSAEAESQVKRLTNHGPWHLDSAEHWAKRGSGDAFRGFHSIGISHCPAKKPCKGEEAGMLLLWFLPAELGGALVAIDRRHFAGEVAQWPAGQILQSLARVAGEPRQSFTAKNPVDGPPLLKYMLFGGKGFVPERFGGFEATKPGGTYLFAQSFSSCLGGRVSCIARYEGIRYELNDGDGVQALNRVERQER